MSQPLSLLHLPDDAIQRPAFSQQQFTSPWTTLLSSSSACCCGPTSGGTGTTKTPTSLCPRGGRSGAFSVEVCRFRHRGRRRSVRRLLLPVSVQVTSSHEGSFGKQRINHPSLCWKPTRLRCRPSRIDTRIFTASTRHWRRRSPRVIGSSNLHRPTEVRSTFPSAVTKRPRSASKGLNIDPIITFSPPR